MVFEGSSSVSKELWIATLERLVSLSLILLNASSVSLLVLVVCGMILTLGHLVDVDYFII